MKKIALFLIALVIATTVVGSVRAQNQGMIVSPTVETTPRVGCFKFTDNLRFTDGARTGKYAQVYELQTALVSGGYLSVTPTGYFGVLTLGAVMNYQRDNAISMTGFVGPLTRGVLRSQYCNTPPIAMCDYAAPPEGCAYVPGPNYNNQTQCGMVLSCNNTPPVAPASCKVWFDGCNTCSRSTPGGPMACTMMACIWANSPAATCKEYFPLIQACPSEKIIDQMPVMCITAPCPAIDRSYYIYQGTRHEITEFDNTWVAQHCSVKETVVY